MLWRFQQSCAMLPRHWQSCVTLQTQRQCCAISCEFVNVGNVQQFSQLGVELSKLDGGGERWWRQNCDLGWIQSFCLMCVYFKTLDWLLEAMFFRKGLMSLGHRRSPTSLTHWQSWASLRHIIDTSAILSRLLSSATLTRNLFRGLKSWTDVFSQVMGFALVPMQFLLICGSSGGCRKAAD